MSDEKSETNHEETITLDPKLASGIKVVLGMFIIIVVAALVTGALIDSHNQLVYADLQVQKSASNVKTDLERRADLLPNLANAVKGSATFEYKTQHDTFVQVAEARALASVQARAAIDKMPATQVAATNTPQEQQVTQILGNFVKLQEEYPNLQLQSVQQFREFGAQVTATENEILVDRQTYNSAVTYYQATCRSFPTMIVAGFEHYNAGQYTMYIPSNQTRAETVPDITFDFSSL
jgi:LemA protein